MLQISRGVIYMCLKASKHCRKIDTLWLCLVEENQCHAKCWLHTRDTIGFAPRTSTRQKCQSREYIRVGKFTRNLSLSLSLLFSERFIIKFLFQVQACFSLSAEYSVNS